MSKRNSDIVPLLLGAGLTAYSISKAFYSAFGVKSHAMGRYKSGISAFSRIMKIEYCSGCLDEDVLLPELFSFSKRRGKKRIILVPCSEIYAEFVVRHRKELSSHFEFIVPSEHGLKLLYDKDFIAKIAVENGLLFYDTAVFDIYNAARILSCASYPAYIKPTLQGEYWRCPFPGMRSLYRVENENEARSVASRIYSYGYKDSLFIQEIAPDAQIFHYTAFFKKDGKFDFGVLAKRVFSVEYEECEDLISETNLELETELKAMFQELGCCGFLSAELLRLDGKFYIYNVKAGLGCCADLAFALDINIAKRLVSAIDGKAEAPEPRHGRVLWHSSPKGVLAALADNGELIAEIETIKKEKLTESPFLYAPDLLFNPLRAVSLLFYSLRVKRRYKEQKFK